MIVREMKVKSDSFIKILKNIHKEEKEDISLRESWIEQEKEMTIANRERGNEKAILKNSTQRFARELSTSQKDSNLSSISLTNVFTSNGFDKK